MKSRRTELPVLEPADHSDSVSWLHFDDLHLPPFFLFSPLASPAHTAAA
jgi:hypothetical protein